MARALRAAIAIAHRGTKSRTDAAASLIERADQCLYQAKHAGRNRVIAEKAGSEMPKALAG